MIFDFFFFPVNKNLIFSFFGQILIVSKIHDNIICVVIKNSFFFLLLQ